MTEEQAPEAPEEPQSAPEEGATPPPEDHASYVVRDGQLVRQD